MKIAIAGFGIEGRASYDYFRRKFPTAEIVIVDERGQADDMPEGVPTVLGAGALTQLNGYDMVVRTAGLAPQRIISDGQVWSATNEFFAECPAPIVGVTGTKGKGTTCSLITSILREAGKTVHLVGNIGVPALEIMPNIQPEDIVVYELSSFQLWDLKKSPHVAVVLMIEPDHLDVHKDFAEYIEAKANIAKLQTAEDLVIYHPTNQYSRGIVANSNARKQRYATGDDGGVYVKNNSFFRDENAICSTDTLHIAGVHNRENACAAISAALEVVPELTNDQIAEGLAVFMGLPHRLKYVDEVSGVQYYDDSIATTPGSAMAALRAFDGPKIIILGGSDKGADYTEVVSIAKETNSRVIAIGQTGQKIDALCQKTGVEARREYGLMDDIVPVAASLASPGSVVILSPASASFDQYASYSDRGNKFIEAVNRLKDSILVDQ